MSDPDDARTSAPATLSLLTRSTLTLGRRLHEAGHLSTLSVTHRSVRAVVFLLSVAGRAASLEAGLERVGEILGPAAV